MMAFNISKNLPVLGVSEAAENEITTDQEECSSCPCRACLRTARGLEEELMTFTCSIPHFSVLKPRVTGRW